jgi:peptidoglycan/xylan/chitin deacetylase (PgdA/CDA1 family)
MKIKEIFFKYKVLIVCIACFILVCLLALLLFSVSKSRSFQFFGDLVSSVETDKKQVAITFDDGPTENTQAILEALDELEIKATFFLCGIDIESRPEDAASIAEAGHGIGNHSYSHQRMILVSYSFCKEEIEKTDELIRSSGYSKEIYFRPPYFKKLFMLPLYLKNNDRITILGDIEPETALGFDASPEDIANYVLANVQNGSIILLHPMYNSDAVLAALKIIVEELRSQGYTFCTVEELLEL